MRWLLLTVALTFACGGDKKSSPPPTDESVPAMPISPEEPSPVAQQPADAGAEPDECVTKCIASRQMQATSVEQIEIDCKKRCSEVPGGTE
jgi:hypothetical protein